MRCRSLPADRRFGLRRPGLLVLGVLVSVLGALPAAANAAPTITEYTTGLTPNLSPLQAAQGPDGNVWFTQNSGTGSIGQITPAGVIQEFATGLTANGNPRGITTGPDGNLWFTETAAGKVAKLTPGTGVIQEYALPAGSSPQGITAGPAGDGNLWVADSGNGGAIWKVSTGGVPTQYLTGLTPNSKPWNITLGPDNNLWFTENLAGRIGRITPATGSIGEYPGLSSAANDIASGPDGKLWFTESGGTGSIGKLDPASGVVTEYSAGLTPNANPKDIAVGGDGRMYFTEMLLNGAVAAITPAGVITEYSAASGLTAGSGPDGITAGADGSIWFTEAGNPGRVAKLTVAPTASTNPAVSVGASAATLAGSVTPNSLATTYYFQYGTTTGYGLQTTSGSLSPTGISQGVTATVAGLSANTLYHYRMVATNGAGTATGPDQTFTTSAPAGGGGGPTGPPSPAGGAAAHPPAQLGTPLADIQAPVRLASGEGSSVSSTPSPVVGQTVVATPSKGQVSIRPAGSGTFAPLAATTPLAVGSTVDASHGAVTIVTALPNHRSQSASFWGGMFQITQRPDGMTDIYLVGGDFRSCGATSKTGKASVARTRVKRAKSPSRKTIRQLWVQDHHGHYTTHGKNSIAAVLGTKWLTQDRCDGTLTLVRQGKVKVTSLKTHRQTLVRTGRRHFAPSR